MDAIKVYKAITSQLKFTKEYTKILVFIASHESSIAFEQSLIYLQVMQDALDEATDSWGVKVT